MKIGIIYPREKKVGLEAISIHWLLRIFNRAKTFFLDSDLSELYNCEKILISCHFENNYPYILQMLSKANIEIFRKKRKQKIYLGGPVAVNPYPLYYFIDAFFIGSFDSNSVKELVENEKKLFVHESIFIPEEKEKVKISRKRDDIYFGLNNEKLLVEIQSGCRNRCYFCLLSWNTPLGFVNFKKLVEKVQSMKFSKIFLIGSDIFSHPEIREIINFIANRNVEISFPSSRINEIEKFKDIIEKLKPKSFTIAPESSERIRNAMGKRFENEEILTACKVLKDCGVEHLKLYFMLGLPGETKEDLEEIAKLISLLRKEFFVSVTFSVFVPKAHTPFQFAPFEDVKTLEKKNKLMKKLLKNVKAHFTNPKKAFIQMLLSIGNKDISQLLSYVYTYGLNYSVWVKTAQKLKIDIEKYSKEKDKSFVFDFENIDTGVSKNTLYKLYEKYKNKVG
ncbi:MAG TPA: radical SAM protein [Nanoarchaeota archaeon]|nr:radical SAM protein [Nanoarchaeota archaeon]